MQKYKNLVKNAIVFGNYFAISRKKYNFAKMKTANRTRRTIQNSRTAFLLFIFQICIGFYSRKIFLNQLGAEVLGINTTLGNILSFLNLAELGIGISMATSLYKPIHEKDQKAICDIISVQGILYRRIALILCILSIPVLISLPFIFPSTQCNILYIYIAYLVFLSGSIFSYLWNFRQILIQADQKNFKLTPWIHLVRYIKIFAQIIILLYSKFGIWGWILLELAGSIATVFVINHILNKEYPWLHIRYQSASELLKRHQDLIIKTKQVFVHKIGSFVLDQTAPLIIYAFVSLTMVTYYGNYIMLIGYIVTLTNIIFEGMGASIGNLVAENNKRHTHEVFWELFTSRIWIAGIACFGIYVFIGPFISFWIGSNYLLSETTLLLLILGMFIRLSRSVVDTFKNAYQLFADVWSPIVEASINLGCSILFGYLWGLNGILLGSNLSLIIIVLLWKPYYTFRYGLKSPVMPYYFQYAFHMLILMAGAFIAKLSMNKFHVEEDNIIYQGIIITFGLIIYIAITYLALYASTKGMRMFTIRIKKIIEHKI